jgi:putative transposase
MNQEEMQILARQVAKQVKDPKDIQDLLGALSKNIIQAALDAELDAHLGYDRNHKALTGNSRNGKTKKTVKGDLGEFELETPRDRNGDFEPQLVPKGQTRLGGMDSKIIALYAQGLSTRDIVQAFKDLYDVELSASTVSRVTDAILEQIKEWQSNPLQPVYPILYLDGLIVPIRRDGRVLNQCVHVALGVDLDGKKQLLGMWIAENEGSAFWLGVLTELKNRGVKEVCVACIDGLSGFGDAVKSAFPRAEIQRCIVHLTRNSMKYVNYKDRKELATDLKTIYNASTETAALQALDGFAEKWGAKYPLAVKPWKANWSEWVTFFKYPEEIRRAIYTTNAIESLNSVLRKAVRKRKVFPSEDAATKVLFLAMKKASEKWTMPIRDWGPALNHFQIMFENIRPYL